VQLDIDNFTIYFDLSEEFYILINADD